MEYEWAWGSQPQTFCYRFMKEDSKEIFQSAEDPSVFYYTEEFLEDLGKNPDQYKSHLKSKFTMKDSMKLSNHEDNFLHLLFKASDVETIKQFCQDLCDSDPQVFLELLDQENKVGWTPIYCIFNKNSVDLLETIVNFDKQIRKSESSHIVKHVCNTGSVLIKACEVSSTTKGEESLKCLEYLLSPPISLDVNQPDHEGCTPLYMACYKGNHSVAKYLLDNGANPGVLCVNGSNSLHICAERDFMDVLKLLCEHQKDLIYTQDDEGNTPLHIASLWSHMGILEYLWELGEKKLVEIRNHDGDTAYELAYEENQIYAHEFLCEKMGINTNTICSLL
ncbi:unnamed protein product [Moneuplotes crassus]|uniref:Ankyrin repeat protein n=1 Tax=Euplotes crassus TaxID=5936 RepID=A0AAD1UR76_EUPCR|nr:unnamed protein product [Moneuplotes crassus]